jgi:hypothetical protein
VRLRHPVSVVDELEYLNSLSFHQINIADDLFTVNKKHCLAICDEIFRRKLQINWTSFARVDTVTPEVLLNMRAAGCQAISFGIESANPEILKRIKKGITLKQIIEAVKQCTQSGIAPYASFILGLPGETPETLKETLDFARSLKDMGLSSGFHLLAPFPGTEIREKSDQFGLHILSNDWSQYHANRAIVETPTVSRKMLDEIVIDWQNEYHAYLADIRERMQRGEASPAESWQLTNLERIVLVYDLMMKGVVEKYGSWPEPDCFESDEALLNQLAGRIMHTTDCNKETLADTLLYALQQGDLMRVRKNGRIRWKWVDYL